MNANHYVIKNKRTGCVELYLNDLLVRNAHSFCICGCKMYVTLSGYNTFVEFNLTARSYKLYSGCTVNASAFANRS